MVQEWQDSILAVAKEEMGHLLTVQNVLTLLGAPINLDRENFPWDIQYYPFKFSLEPLTLKSLSHYVFAEMPPEDQLVPKPKTKGRTYREVNPGTVERILKEARATAQGSGEPHRVGAIYEEIIAILQDKQRIPDSAFNDRTYEMQQDWDDWGRIYRPNPKLLRSDGNIDTEHRLVPALKHEANVLIDRAATRSQAIKALRALAEQGEAPHLGESEEDKKKAKDEKKEKTKESPDPSHFERFVEIYEQLEKLGSAPTRRLPENPTTFTSTQAGNTAQENDRDKIGEKGVDQPGYIQVIHSRRWADLFNLRYRMLLMYLAHTFRLARTTSRGTPGARGMMMHKVFGEMYNLKTIAGILVQLPLKDDPKNEYRAAPPFETPYSLALPPSENDAWRLHLDLLGTSADLRKNIGQFDQTREAPEQQAYLKTMGDLDHQSTEWIESVIAGLSAAERLTV
jgi:hypothetical protein